MTFINEENILRQAENLSAAFDAQFGKGAHKSAYFGETTVINGKPVFTKEGLIHHPALANAFNPKAHVALSANFSTRALNSPKPVQDITWALFKEMAVRPYGDREATADFEAISDALDEKVAGLKSAPDLVEKNDNGSGLSKLDPMGHVA